jgi:hypothetical protein
MQVQEYNTPRQSTMLDYSVNVYKDDLFVKSLRYQGYSGTSMHEEVRDLRNYTYRPSDGYRLEW